MPEPETATATVSPGEETEVTLSVGDPAFCHSAGNILFPTGTSFIAPSPGHKQAYRAVIDRLAASPAERLLMVGHTDDIGSAGLNRSLSERRARATLAVLTDAVAEWEATFWSERGNASSSRWGDADFTTMLTETGNPATPQEIREHRELSAAGEARRATLFRSYFQALRDGDPAPAALPSLAPPLLGCGEDHVLASGDHQPSRRAEFFLVLGAPATAIECRLYPNWQTACGAIPVVPRITVARNLLVVEKPHTQPARVQVDLQTNLPFPRNGTFTRSSDAVSFFDAAVGGNEIVFTGNSVDFTGAQLTAGVRLFAEARRASGSLNDIRLTLTLAPGAAPRAAPPATADVTAVELTLEVASRRPASGVAPPLLPQPPATPPAPGVAAADKWFGGRIVSVQDAADSQERALLFVGQVEPPDFTGELRLRQVSISGNSVTGLANRVDVFDNERPTAGEVAKANPHDFAAATTVPSGVEFFVEGTTFSADLRDTGYQLGIKDVEDDGDRIALTVVLFEMITQSNAVMPMTGDDACFMVSKIVTNVNLPDDATFSGPPGGSPDPDTFRAQLRGLPAGSNPTFRLDILRAGANIFTQGFGSVSGAIAGAATFRTDEHVRLVSNAVDSAFRAHQTPLVRLQDVVRWSPVFRGNDITSKELPVGRPPIENGPKAVRTSDIHFVTLRGVTSDPPGTVTRMSENWAQLAIRFNLTAQDVRDTVTNVLTIDGAAIVAGQLSVTITPSGGAATNVISAFAAGATAQQVATQLAADIAANVGLTATAHRHQAMFIVLVNRGNEVAFANIASTTPSVLFQEPALNFTDAINLLEGSVLGLNFNDSDPTTIDMIAVENIPVLGVLGATGGDFLAANLPGWHNVAIVGERAVDPTNLSPFVAGHEVGHAIFDGGNGIHNTTNPQNLFQPAVSPADTIGATKRLDDAQNTRARLLSGPATVPALLDRR